MGTQERNFTVPGDTVFGSDFIPDVDVNIVAEQSPGSLDIGIEVTFRSPAPEVIPGDVRGAETLSDIAQGGFEVAADVITLGELQNEFTFRLEPSLGEVDQFRRQLKSEITSQFRSGLGMRRRAALNVFSNSIQTPINNVSGELRDIAGTQRAVGVDIAEVPLGSQETVSTSMSFDFPTVSIPGGEDVISEAWNSIGTQTADEGEIRGPTFDVVTSWSSGFFSTSRRRSTFAIEQQLLFDVRETDIDCSVAYPDIPGEINSMRQDVNSKLTEVEGRASDLENAVNRLTDAAGVSASVNLSSGTDRITRRDALRTIPDGGNPIPGLTPDDILSSNPREISQIRGQIQTVNVENLPGRDISDIFSEINSIRSNIENQVELEQCANQFEQQLGPINETVNSIASLRQEMIQIKDRALSVIERGAGGDCAEEFPGLDSDISSFESDIQDIDIQSLRQQNLTQSELRSELPTSVSALRDRMVSLRSDIGEEAGGTPCADLFQSRLDDVQSRINTLSGLETVDGSCAEQFPGLDGDISDAESAAETTVGTIESAFRQRIQQGESREEVVDALTTDDGGIIPRLARGAKSPQEQLDRIEQLKDRVREDTSGQVRRRDVPELPGGAPVAPGEPVETEGSPQCRENFINRLETVEESLNSALNFEFDVRGRVPTNCAEAIPRALGNDISTFRVDANSVDENSSRQRVQRVVSEGDRLIQRINRSDIPQECKDDRVGTVRRELSDAKSLLEDIGRVQVNCTEEFSGIDSDIESFQNDVAFLSGPSQQQISNLTNRGEQLIERVERTVDEQNCQREFTNRIREAVSTLQERQQRVTVSPGEGLERIEERQKRIEDLQGRTQELIQQIAETPVQDRLEDELPET